MTTAVIKLESFTAAANSAATPMFSQSQLDQARDEGIAAGMARQENDQVGNLRAGLDRLTAALSDDETRRAALRAEAVASLTPILSEMLDALTPSTVSQRLERELLNTLRGLAAETTPLRARIAFSPALRGMVERCIAESGAMGIELDDTGTERVSLSLRGGRIEFSQDRIAGQIRALIAEIKDEDRTWTH
ncbi:hypothetical protein [Paracoccus sp. (in: a-proteobacteria)]|uniref:hypothetical protein n=1 Tax=Paracoccus sp. TaxID=267 RepID=UPI003A888EF8